jgi:Flp pilus assembly protein TadG
VTLKARCKKLCRRMRADANKGSAAIEFAFVAPVFFVLLLGIFESGVMFFTQSALQNAVTDIGRTVRTGQAGCYTMTGTTCNAMTETQFKTAICSTAGYLIPSCTSNVILDMEAASSGFSGTDSDPLSGNSSTPPASRNFQATDQFALGNACDVVTLRAYYQWPVSTPLLTWFLVNMAGNKHLIAAASAFRNEPYNEAQGSC